jgi:hypothetical protein
MRKSLYVKAAALLLVAALLGAGLAGAQESQDAWSEPVLEDCSTDGLLSPLGTNWEPQLDSGRGGKSTIEAKCADGELSASGTVVVGVPWRGPGTAGLLLPLSTDQSRFDVSGFAGLRITVKRSGAQLLLRIHTGGVDNGDYFAAEIPASDGFETYEIPFTQMGQVMSPQRQWTGKDAYAVELVAWSFGKADYSWAITSLELYK